MYRKEKIYFDIYVLYYHSLVNYYLTYIEVLNRRLVIAGNYIQPKIKHQFALIGNNRSASNLRHSRSLVNHEQLFFLNVYT